MVFKLLAMYMLMFPTMTACHPESAQAVEQRAETPADQPIAMRPVPAGAEQGAPAQTQPAAVGPDEDAPAIIIPDEVDELLDTLEASAADLRSFTAEITYTKEDDLLGRREKRSGRLIYLVDQGTGQKRFAALFDRYIVNRRGSSRLHHYVFDGRWLAEIDHESRSFIKREIVAPGRQLDPLKLGEGPFPLPIGQPKADVLARFHVALFTPDADNPLAAVAKKFDVDGLLLIPRAGTKEQSEYAKVELLYDRVTRLPVGVNVIEIDGDRKTVELSDPKRNPTLNQVQRDNLSIDEPDPEQWRIDVRQWQD